MKPRWSARKHFERQLTYPVTLTDWLETIDSTLASYTVEAPTGLTVSHSIAGDVIALVMTSGTVGKPYTVIVRAVAADGQIFSVPITMRVFGSGQVIVTQTDVVTLIEGSAPMVGAGIARVGADWGYQYLVEADAAGASAELRIRVGHTPSCPLVFGPDEDYSVTVTVSGTPDLDGKYRGAAEEGGNQAWAYHAADILAISGTGAVASVTGAQT